MIRQPTIATTFFDPDTRRNNRRKKRAARRELRAIRKTLKKLR